MWNGGFAHHNDAVAIDLHNPLKISHIQFVSVIKAQDTGNITQCIELSVFLNYSSYSVVYSLFISDITGKCIGVTACLTNTVYGLFAFKGVADF